jgi:hypothetical protein
MREHAAISEAQPHCSADQQRGQYKEYQENDKRLEKVELKSKRKHKAPEASGKRTRAVVIVITAS